MFICRVPWLKNIPILRKQDLRCFSTGRLCFDLRTETFKPNISSMLPKQTFSGKVAFITGGGTGLGKGMATRLSELGATVFITSRRKDVITAACEEISSQTGNKVYCSPGDVRSPESVSSVLDRCVSDIGLPNIIINNAAGNFISPTERLSPNAWKTIVDIVLNGTANVTLDVGKRLINAGQGAVFLAITTTYTQSGSAFVTPSASAKAGVEALYKSLSSEWSRHGMRFNCLAPGPIETEGAFKRLDPTGELKKRWLERIPSVRTGEVGELSNLASYLVSDYSSWMTGEVVRFDGGLYPNIAGEFSALQSVTSSQWDDLEKMIRSASETN